MADIFSQAGNNNAPVDTGIPAVARYVTASNATSTLGTISLTQGLIAAKSTAASPLVSAQGLRLLATCLITQIRDTKEVAYQAEPTISGELFLNYFGSKPTEYAVSGIAFDGLDCSGKQASADDPLTSLYEFYSAHRLGFKVDKVNGSHYSKVEDLVTVTTYNTVFGTVRKYTGLLTRMEVTLAASNPSGLRQYNFTFSFLSLN